MEKNKPVFSPENFVETQAQIFDEASKKLDDLFIRLVAPRGLDKLTDREYTERTRFELLELVGVLRQTFSWFAKINRAMVYQNRKRIPKQKKSLN